MSTKAIREALMDYLRACARANDFAGRAREPDDGDNKAYLDALAELEAIERELAASRSEVEALKKEHAEDQGVIAVWRGRTERAEADNAALLDAAQETAGILTERDWQVRQQKAHGILALLEHSHPGAALLEELRGLRVQAEMLQSAHAQVAEVAKMLDPEVIPDTWGLHAAATKRMEELRTARAQVESLGLEVQLAREDVLEEADRRASAVHEGLKMDSDRARALKLDEHSQAITLGRVQGSFDVLFALRFMKSRR